MTSAECGPWYGWRMETRREVDAVEKGKDEGHRSSIKSRRGRL